ncbi:proline iminopeptidase-family hydrolase [Rhodospirillaceae bacterium SYSU D60014]|uniref:proline iminopeptidase-family hydrolase n=1 Tax=Virgifigura deserti TaxID=2268457 RepID=UPI000E66F0A8
MTQARKPDASRRVRVDGYEVVTYSYGEGDEVVFLLNGGPGLPSTYLREPMLRLLEHGYRVVTYDQLGTGASDRPSDPALWTITRYVGEVETVRRALGLGPVHLFGHSWGGWLGIEYALTHPAALKTLTLSNSCGDMPHLISELNRLRAALGSETVAMMQRHEAEGRFDHPEYKAAITILNHRHGCRLDDWPEPLTQSIREANREPYNIMQGPNEFLYVGNLKDWNRVPDMHRITVPCLVLVGQHDELTPACAMRMHRALPDSRIRVFKNSGHMPIYEEPEAYFATLLEFLAAHRG